VSSHALALAAEQLGSRSAATLAESGGLVLPSAIRPLSSGIRVGGPARTVLTTPGHNLWLHRAIVQAAPEEVLVVSTQEGHDFGYWGEVMGRAAAERGIAGLVIDGCVRDTAALRALPVAVFARGACIRGTGKSATGGGVGHPIAIGGVTVATGDIVVGDDDGVVVVPASAVADVAGRAARRDEHERTVFDAIGRGRSTIEIYGWEAT